MKADLSLALSSGHCATLRARPLPLLPLYHVLFFPPGQGAPSAEEEREMFGLAYESASRLGTRHHGDPGCFVILYSGRRTRRRPWPHFHIVPARDLRDKRRALLLLHLKRVLAWLPIGRGRAG